MSSLACIQKRANIHSQSFVDILQKQLRRIHHAASADTAFLKEPT